MNNSENIKFRENHRDFKVTLNRRVSEYFKINSISRHANSEMVFKSIFMFALYFLPYSLILSGIVTSPFMTILMVCLMSLGLAGIGLTVMHDGNHGAYSKRRWINVMIGYSLNLIGANSFNWKIQHNVKHHTYTNVNEEDEDISPKGVLRLNPHSKWRRFHKYQFIYAWFIYGLMTISWMFFKDIAQLMNYQSQGLLVKYKASVMKEWLILITTKLFYIGYIFFVPLMLTDWRWWQIAIGIVIMHYITGFLLAIIFQPAHVIEGSEFPLPDKQNRLRYNRLAHQLYTTANFGNKSRWFTWLIGGLNFQIEHHLFPSICHVHYPNISKIVKSTATEFGLPYRSIPSFGKALVAHMRQLKLMGIKSI